MYIGGSELSYVASYTNGLYSPYFLMILYFINFFNLIITYSSFSKNYEFIIRTESNKSFFDRLLSYSKKNLFLIITIQISLFTLIFTFVNGINDFVISESLYMIYHILKIYILAFLVNKLNICLLQFINKYFIILINSLMYFSIVFASSWQIFKLNEYYLYGFISDYLNLYLFPNFLTNVSSFSLYCCFFLIIIDIVYYICCNIDSFYAFFLKLKYIIINDINYIFNHFFNHIIIYMIITIFSYFIFKFTGSIMDNQIIYYIVGLDFSMEIEPIAIILFGLHVSISIYIIFHLITKDINNGIDNIFLRILPKDWISCKLVSSSIIYFMIKLIIYILLFMIMKLDKFNLSLNLFSLFVLDYMYFILIQLICLLIYMLKPVMQIIIIIIATLLLIEFQLFNIIQFGNFKLIIFSIVLLTMLLIKKFFSNTYVEFFEKNRR